MSCSGGSAEIEEDELDGESVEEKTEMPAGCPLGDDIHAHEKEHRCGIAKIRPHQEPLTREVRSQQSIEPERTQDEGVRQLISTRERPRRDCLHEYCLTVF
jgi:hypothetical protein